MLGYRAEKSRKRFSLAAAGFLLSALAPAAQVGWPSEPARALASRADAAARPCGARKHARVDEVMLIWEENHSFGSVIGNPQAPEINSLAAECGLATGYVALTHPSLPNYMEMTSGLPYTSFPWYTDCDPLGPCRTAAPSIFSALDAAGKQWRSFAESMGTNCGLVTYGYYAARHNPAVYYTNIRDKCDQWDQPLGTPEAGPLHRLLAEDVPVALITVTPNVEDDMHNGTVAEADKWLSRWVPEVTSSLPYRSGRLAIVLAWDEGFGAGDHPSSVPLVVVSASTHSGSRFAGRLDDYSVLRTIAGLTGVRPPGLAGAAPSFAGPFNL
jgi:hypothetical protein